MGGVEMARVVLDTVGLVTGLLSGGGTGEMPGLCKIGELRLAMSRADCIVSADRHLLRLET